MLQEEGGGGEGGEQVLWMASLTLLTPHVSKLGFFHVHDARRSRDHVRGQSRDHTLARDLARDHCQTLSVSH